MDEIWIKYDTDGNGELDFDEVKALVKEMLHESSKDADFSLDEFKTLFAEFDANGNDVIDKNEMKRFILQLCGFGENDIKYVQTPGIK